MVSQFRFNIALLLTMSAPLLLANFGWSAEPVVANAQSSTPQTNFYPARGVIKELLTNGVTARIQHEEIPGYMPAMTMPLSVKNPAELRNLAAGDAITFRLVVTDDDSWIDHVQRAAQATAPSSTVNPPVRIAPEVAELEVGDMLPGYTLTNHLGRAFNTDDFRGQPFAFTFFFTRCPLPQFCPRMSRNFADVQAKMKSRSDAPERWALLSISFDPAFDTTAVLKSHADAFGADPKHWQFATGSLADITALGEHFGLMFWTREGTIEHNLRTVVVDPRGRIQKIIIGNEWNPDEVVEELIEASKKATESGA